MPKQLTANIQLDIAQEAYDQNLQGAANYNSTDGGFSVLFGNLMSIIMLLAAILVFAFLIMGALQWLTSGGDKNKVEGARNKMTNAVICLLIL